ncbi:hypothetical protein K435DRAFT_862291 [Dendrothele bispora CBS 962.96]|uniref:Uncharacterized protein n=1 Tax=Dendrothele bispora (strain CBS 962.96) TaxID=1314807 RepID=A0A4S8LSX6_DENBC|nr:hypothetical protein K435DRAFT_862291 [Dendrothele bispora CBS 962.96]
MDPEAEPDPGAEFVLDTGLLLDRCHVVNDQVQSISKQRRYILLKHRQMRAHSASIHIIAMINSTSFEVSETSTLSSSSSFTSTCRRRSVETPMTPQASSCLVILIIIIVNITVTLSLLNRSRRCHVRIARTNTHTKIRSTIMILWLSSLSSLNKAGSLSPSSVSVSPERSKPMAMMIVSRTSNQMYCCPIKRIRRFQRRGVQESGWRSSVVRAWNCERFTRSDDIHFKLICDLAHPIMTGRWVHVDGPISENSVNSVLWHTWASPRMSSSSSTSLLAFFTAKLILYSSSSFPLPSSASTAFRPYSTVKSQNSSTLPWISSNLSCIFCSFSKSGPVIAQGIYSGG